MYLMPEYTQYYRKIWHVLTELNFVAVHGTTYNNF